MTLEKAISVADDRALDLAPVLLVDDDVASRLTLQTLLRAGGYNVDVASSAAEAIEKLDSSQYVLVLSDLGMKSPEEGLKVLLFSQAGALPEASLEDLVKQVRSLDMDKVRQEIAEAEKNNAGGEKEKPN